MIDAAAFTVAMRDANIDKEFSGRLFEFLDEGARLALTSTREGLFPGLKPTVAYFGWGLLELLVVPAISVCTCRDAALWLRGQAELLAIPASAILCVRNTAEDTPTFDEHCRRIK